MQPPAVGEDRHRGQLPRQGNLGGVEPGGQAVGGGRRDLRQVVAASVKPQRGGVGGGERLQVIDDPGQPEHFVPQRATSATRFRRSCS